jgi:electron transfer flavoprotein beta subunit
MLGELLDLPSVSIIKKLELEGDKATVEREIEGGKEVLTIPLPFVAGTAEGVAEPKIPNMRGIMSARTKPLTVIEPAEVKTNSEIISYETPAPRGQVTLVAADDAAKLIDLLHTEARVI